MLNIDLFLNFSVIGHLEWFWMGSLPKNIPQKLVFLKAPYLVLRLQSINELPVDAICKIYSNCDQVSNFWKRPELASELESDLQKTWTFPQKMLEKLHWHHMTHHITVVPFM